MALREGLLAEVMSKWTPEGQAGVGREGWEDKRPRWTDQGPGPSFSLHPGQPLPREGASLEQVSAVGRLLYLGQAQRAQEGTYTCECSNVAGNSSQDQRLEVHGEPGWDGLTRRRGRKGRQCSSLAGQTHCQNPSKDRDSDDEDRSPFPLRWLAVSSVPLPSSFCSSLSNRERGALGPRSPQWPGEKQHTLKQMETERKVAFLGSSRR